MSNTKTELEFTIISVTRIPKNNKGAHFFINYTFDTE